MKKTAGQIANKVLRKLAQNLAPPPPPPVPAPSSGMASTPAPAAPTTPSPDAAHLARMRQRMTQGPMRQSQRQEAAGNFAPVKTTN